MIKAPPTPKGFRDIGPELAKKRRRAINTIVSVFEEFGFIPMETPTIEFAETLKGKYGEEEKLIYEFEDRGGRKLALRYDLTVPFARFVASNLNLIAKGPFRRYQIGQVFRGENPQKGRWREFTQLDCDTIGNKEEDSPKEDAKIIAAALLASRKLNLKTIMAVNDRKNFEGIPVDVIRSFDKLNKIGRPAVEKEIENRGYTKKEVGYYVEKMLNAEKTDNLKKIFLELGEYKDENGNGLAESYDFYYDSSLARGLDYYTGVIIELKEDKTQGLSLGGGGRYDNLIGMFVYPAKGGAKKQIPAVGFSFGLDRLVELLPG